MAFSKFLEKVGILESSADPATQTTAPVAPEATPAPSANKFSELASAAASLQKSGATESIPSAPEANQNLVDAWASTFTETLQRDATVEVVFKFLDMWPKLNKIADHATRVQVTLDTIGVDAATFGTVLDRALVNLTQQRDFELKQVDLDAQPHIDDIVVQNQDLAKEKEGLLETIRKIDSQVEENRTAMDNIVQEAIKTRAEINTAGLAVHAVLSATRP